MQKQITFVIAALFAAAVISFGCSDEGGGGEIPTDIGGNYIIKSSTCPFAIAEGKFSVTQSPTNKETLSISLKSAQKGAATVGAPDFYESSVAGSGLDDQSTKTSVISASVSAGGGLTAQIKYGEVTYDCSGSFKKEGETKLTDLNCSTGSNSCSFSAKGTATTGGTVSDDQPTCAETGCPEGEECKNNECIVVEVKCESPKVKIYHNAQQKYICVGYSDEIVFPDKNLESAVRAAIDKTQGTITFGDVSEKDTVDFSGKGISNLSGMEHFVILADLELGENNVSDLSPLKGLTKMRWLNLSKNKVTNVGVLVDMVNLDSLDLRFNVNLKDISSLGKNPGWGKGDKIYLYGTGVDYNANKETFSTLINKGVCIITAAKINGPCYNL